MLFDRAPSLALCLCCCSVRLFAARSWRIGAGNRPTPARGFAPPQHAQTGPPDAGMPPGRFTTFPRHSARRPRTAPR
ncbi:hypothetical protein BBSC_0150 [Bifidobacterium scardovii JCM 12489 = DSM 13734]|nr:hypothetical protein BBSC_0150 [Bifidobacterium scardovii JCM 12489 = DSM 13734]